MPALTSAAAPSPSCPDLPWQTLPRWHVLLTDVAEGHDVVALWAAWLADAQRPAQLFITAVCPPGWQGPSHVPPPLQHLADTLHRHCFGLLPGVHRISLEGGSLQLTLWVGDVHTMLRQQSSTADTVLMPAMVLDAHAAKALSRHCRRGSMLYAPHAPADTLHALATAGFALSAQANAQPAVFDPRWQPRLRADAAPQPAAQAGSALVIGAGLAGAAIAYSLAQRGWQVTVLAEGAAPADGASGLPAGLFCPHVSPDDSVLSRLSRSGVRMTLQRLQALCQEGVDWAPSGVLEHCTDGGTGLPTHWAQGPGQDWSTPATAAQLQAAGLPDSTTACWHQRAGWVRPAQLVQAQLRHPHIRWSGASTVAQLQRSATGQWQAFNPQGQILAHADIAVVASGPATPRLIPSAQHWGLQAIRGQITWGLHDAVNNSVLPPFPVNGNGNLVTHIPLAQGTGWIMGSTFERDVTHMPIDAADQAAAHAVNHGKLSTLIPSTRHVMAPWFDPAHPLCQPTWGRVRCASHDRLPIAGPVSPHMPGLWVLTALGARGLTLSVLCGELIAARLHAEPLPLDAKLATHLGTERLTRAAHTA